MGNHHSQSEGSGPGQSASEGGSGASTPRAGSRRGKQDAKAAAPALPPQPQPLPPDEAAPALLPIEKLAKLLVQYSQKEQNVNGVTEECFIKYLFPKYVVLGSTFFRYLHHTGRCTNRHIPQATFRSQCERILSMLDDMQIIETYVRMFSDHCSHSVTSDQEQPPATISSDQFLELLHNSYRISMDNHPDGLPDCPEVDSMLECVLEGCFGATTSHSVGFVARWVQEHLPRVTLPLHRQLVHVLATAYRALHAGDAEAETGRSFASVQPVTLARDASEAGDADELCAGAEWRDSHQYWGGPQCALLQLRPAWRALARGPDLLYLNSGARGYPLGLRAGPEARSPLVAVDAAFERVALQGASHELLALEVWGCGSAQARAQQLDVKRWQVREAERQRHVKLSAADWHDHPDRYLLELAGRPQYSDSK